MCVVLNATVDYTQAIHLTCDPFHGNTALRVQQFMNGCMDAWIWDHNTRACNQTFNIGLHIRLLMMRNICW